MGLIITLAIILGCWYVGGWLYGHRNVFVKVLGAIIFIFGLFVMADTLWIQCMAIARH